MSVVSMRQSQEHILHVNTSTWQAEIVLTNNANLVRLHHVATGLDLLRTPDSLDDLRRTPERYGMPLLFPPARIAGGRFTMNGREYVFPLNDPQHNCNLHGLLLGEPWTLIEVKETDDETMVRMELNFGSNHHCFAGFPHEFRLELTYRFTPGAVTQETTVTNQSTRPMPFGLGYHTAFRVPFGPWSETAERNCRITATTGDGYWEMSPESRMPTGQLLPLTDSLNYWKGRSTGSLPVGVLYSAETQNIENKSFHGAIIESPSDSARLIYETSSEYQFWALWNDGGGKGFFCVEPFTWISNAPNSVLPPEITGLQVLAPDQSWFGQTKLQFLAISDKNW